ncbi:MAG TPA: 50S ribosomal protein L23 [Dehalococcoidia bacterium]|jgi:large subunit ribosomal protein L23|nr:50S ribosomal protein L23 [Dehalococcoidia bacterium]
MPKQLNAYGIIIRPLITEKAQNLTGFNKYAFEVDLRANKLQVKEAVETAFDVKVTAVNTCMMKGKVRRFGRGTAKRPDWKKAIVTLAPGEKIELFEGV